MAGEGEGGVVVGVAVGVAMTVVVAHGVHAHAQLSTIIFTFIQSFPLHPFFLPPQSASPVDDNADMGAGMGADMGGVEMGETGGWGAEGDGADTEGAESRAVGGEGEESSGGSGVRGMQVSGWRAAVGVSVCSSYIKVHASHQPLLYHHLSSSIIPPSISDRGWGCHARGGHRRGRGGDGGGEGVAGGNTGHGEAR